MAKNYSDYLRDLGEGQIKSVYQPVNGPTRQLELAPTMSFQGDGHFTVTENGQRVIDSELLEPLKGRGDPTLHLLGASIAKVALIALQAGDLGAKARVALPALLEIRHPTLEPIIAQALITLLPQDHAWHSQATELLAAELGSEAVLNAQRNNFPAEYPGALGTNLRNTFGISGEDTHSKHPPKPNQLPDKGGK